MPRDGDLCDRSRERLVAFPITAPSVTRRIAVVEVVAPVHFVASLVDQHVETVAAVFHPVPEGDGIRLATAKEVHFQSFRLRVGTVLFLKPKTELIEIWVRVVAVVMTEQSIPITDVIKIIRHGEGDFERVFGIPHAPRDHHVQIGPVSRCRPVEHNKRVGIGKVTSGLIVAVRVRPRALLVVAPWERPLVRAVDVKRLRIARAGVHAARPGGPVDLRCAVGAHLVAATHVPDGTVVTVNIFVPAHTVVVVVVVVVVMIVTTLVKALAGQRRKRKPKRAPIVNRIVVA